MCMGHFFNDPLVHKMRNLQSKVPETAWRPEWRPASGPSARCPRYDRHCQCVFRQRQLVSVS
jgi:hypothetical protein